MAEAEKYLPQAEEVFALKFALMMLIGRFASGAPDPKKFVSEFFEDCIGLSPKFVMLRA